MRWVIYNGNQRYCVPGFSVKLKSQTPLAVKFINNNLISSLETTWNEDDERVITIEFTPVDEATAQALVDSKTLYFGIVRHRADHYGKESRRSKDDESKNHAGAVSDNFPYSPEDYEDLDGQMDFSILATYQDNENKFITKQELMAGSITRNVYHLDELVCRNRTNYRTQLIEDGGNWYCGFYIGFIYYERNTRVPTAYLMESYAIINNRTSSEEEE